ncbi:MAG: porin family protein, partial [Chlamydiae bacterium]|nr:porin family protein [Chlamydiota bacterium]
MKRKLLISLLGLAFCLSAEQSEIQVKRYAEKYSGFSMDLGVGYSGLSIDFTYTLPTSTHVTSWGDSGVAVQFRIGGGTGFFDYWFVGLDSYAQYNSVKSTSNYQATGGVAKIHTFTLPCNLGFQGKIGFVYKPSNMIFLLGGPDWALYSFKDVADGFSSSQFNVGARFGAGAEQKFGEHWIMKETFDYAWFPSRTYGHGAETEKVEPRLATFLFSLSYLL